MNFFRLLLFGSLFLILMYIPDAGFSQTSADLYSRGMQEAENGDVEAAIDTWLGAKEVSDIPSMHIGTAFIELVTQEKKTDYYEFATLMYQWGISGREVSPNKQVLEDEIERLGFLVDNKLYNRWRDLLKNNDALIYDELSAFWKQLDPTPTTQYNERLIEHWERIVYSQKHFDRSKSGVLKADDRAKIYLRYGPPTKRNGGTLTFDASAARSYIDNITNTPLGCSAPAQQIDAMTQAVRNLHQYPDFEVWIYRDQSSSSVNNIFLFGSESFSGGLELVDTIEDFIPNRAFNLGNSVLPLSLRGVSPCLSNIRPGLILQLLYYYELATVDVFFSSTFNQIKNRAVTYNGGSVSKSLSQEVREASIIDLNRRKLKAPKQTSNYESAMFDIPTEVYQYRLLDDLNKIYFATFIESKPRDAFLIDYLSNYSNEGANPAKIDSIANLNMYQYTHTMQLRNPQNGELRSQAQDNPLITTNKNGTSASLFFVPFVEEGFQQVFSSKLENVDSASSYSIKGTPFPKKLRGLSKVVVEQPSPLDNDPAKLQMGDLIVGYNYNAKLDPKYKFPFQVSNTKTIPQNENIVLHFEIYNITRNENGRHNVQLSYEISPKKGFLGWLKKQESNLKLTLNLESGKPRYIENIQIKTRVLKPDTYIIKVIVKDTETQQTVERDFEFEVIEEESS